MARRNSRWVVGIGAVAVLAGCASQPIGRSVAQELRVETPGCPQARCELRNDWGRWVVEATPASVVVQTSDKPLELSCRSMDVESGMRRSISELRPASETSSSAGAAVGGGIAAAIAAPAAAVGGPFTLVFAAAVVAGGVTGSNLAHTTDASGREFAYPSVLQMPMRCGPPLAEEVAMAGSTWGLIVGAPTPDQGGPAGAIRVKAVAQGGRAAAAGLRVGDVVVAIDGRPVTGTLGFEVELRLVTRPVMLQVLRDGQRVDLQLSPGSPR
jgi:hypothetical protein